MSIKEEQEQSASKMERLKKTQVKEIMQSIPEDPTVNVFNWTDSETIFGVMSEPTFYPKEKFKERKLKKYGDRRNLPLLRECQLKNI